MELGVLESPPFGACAEWGDVIEIRGWIARPQASSVRARIGTGSWQNLASGLSRPDLPLGPHGPLVGFGGHLRSGLPGQCGSGGDGSLLADLEVEVLLDNEERLRWRRSIRFEPSGHSAWRWVENSVNSAKNASSVSVTWVIQGEGTAWLTTKQSVEAVCGPSVAAVAGTAESHPPAQTDWIGFLVAGDRLCAAGWLSLCDELARGTDACLIYADHVDHEGAIVFKPAAAPVFHNASLMWDRGWLVRQQTWSRRPPDLHGSDWWHSLVASAAHAPWPLCIDGGPRRQRNAPQSRSSKRPTLRESVSVVIPTRLSDRSLLEGLLRSLPVESECGDLDVEPVLVLNNLVADMFDLPRGHTACKDVRLLRHEGSFNWSAINNWAVRQTESEWLLFLNDDIEVLRPGWISAMHRTALLPGVGIVGAVLRYPDGLLQHAGVWMGREGRARHTFRYCTGDEPNVRPLLREDRPQAAVTGACLLIRREDFRRLGGFDVSLPVVCNDIDLCLRARLHGLLSVVCAGAELVHHEGLSRGGIAENQDHQRFHDRWKRLIPQQAPERHPALDTGRDDWRADPASPWPTRLRVAR